MFKNHYGTKLKPPNKVFTDEQDGNKLINENVYWVDNDQYLVHYKNVYAFQTIF